MHEMALDEDSMMTTTARSKVAKAGPKSTAHSNAKEITPALPVKEGKSKEQRMADAGQSSVLANAITALTFAKGTFGELDVGASVEAMHKKVDKVKAGDLSGVEATLVAQSAALNAIFTELARRGALNMGEYLNSTETYLRLALKAQSQCRATLETLANIKKPPVAYVRQANISHGPQQVNNGIPVSSDAGENESQQNKLLERQHGEWVDGGKTGTASGADKAMATMAEVNGPNDC